MIPLDKIEKGMFICMLRSNLVDYVPSQVEHNGSILTEVIPVKNQGHSEMIFMVAATDLPFGALVPLFMKGQVVVNRLLSSYEWKIMDRNYVKVVHPDLEEIEKLFSESSPIND